MAEYRNPSKSKYHAIHAHLLLHGRVVCRVSATGIYTAIRGLLQYHQSMKVGKFIHVASVTVIDLFHLKVTFTLEDNRSGTYGDSIDILESI